MGSWVFAAHSGFRYVVLLFGAATLVAGLAGSTSGPASRAGQFAFRLYRIYVGTLDLQLLLGIGTVALRPFLPAFIGHIVMVALGIVVAHAVSVRLRKTPAAERRPSTVLLGVVLSLGLIVAGILAIGRPIV